MSILCTLKNINLSFGSKVIFKDAQIIISKGDHVGLLGLNGKGKSSLLKILVEDLVPDITAPPFQFDKNKGLTDTSNQFSVFMVPQSFPLIKGGNISIKNYFFSFYPQLQKIMDELTATNHSLESERDNTKIDILVDQQSKLLEEFENCDGHKIQQSYLSYLKYFGLQDFNLEVKDLSGGEQKKILLSLGLSSTTNLILWDEPTNHLDLESIKLFEEELEQLSTAYIIISHDRYLLSKLTKKIFHIEHGKIKQFDGSYADYLEHLQLVEHSQAKLLTKLKNSLKRETDWMRQGIKARGCRSKKRVEEYHNLIGKITDIKAKAKQDLQLALHGSSRQTRNLIEFKEVSFAYPNSAELLSNLSLTIKKGDRIGIIGSNGQGKTTLVNLIAQSLPPTTGQIKRAQNIVVLHFDQKRQEFAPELTPHDILTDGSDMIHLPGGRKKHISAYFESFLFDRGDLHRPIKTFSGGEISRLQLAHNLCKSGDLWIFDEPTNDLDLETLQILEQKLIEFDGSIVLICHDRAFLSAVTNKIWLMKEKSIENFNAGHSQVESYLEANALEKLLVEEKPNNTNETTLQNRTNYNQVVKLTNRQKERLKKLPIEIENQEQLLAKLEDQIEHFDFNNNSKENLLHYNELSRSKVALEEKLLELYEELENIELKN
ncbi:MAG: ABC-F family ATP-binding cassette domain-containing protein [Bacteriovoracaceae bacterium]|nr:ABC-F family ATP-binding cassette domain-containing protein [Bacteriovoracaceae bacterium]